MFEHFLIHESPCFDSIENDYFEIVYQPVLDSEKRHFFYQKLQSCVTVLGIIGSHGNLFEYISRFLKMDLLGNGFVGTINVYELLVYEYFEGL